MLKTFREMVTAAKAEIEEAGHEAVEPDVLVLDVREAEEYRSGHVPGARSLPRGLIELKIDELTNDPDQRIVCYCGGGSRSALAALTLKQMGYRNVASLRGGFRGWRDADRRVEAALDDAET